MTEMELRDQIDRDNMFFVRSLNSASTQPTRRPDPEVKFSTMKLEPGKMTRQEDDRNPIPLQDVVVGDPVTIAEYVDIAFSDTFTVSPDPGLTYPILATSFTIGGYGDGSLTVNVSCGSLNETRSITYVPGPPDVTTTFSIAGEITGEDDIVFTTTVVSTPPIFAQTMQMRIDGVPISVTRKEVE